MLGGGDKGAAGARADAVAAQSGRRARAPPGARVISLLPCTSRRVTARRGDVRGCAQADGRPNAAPSSKNRAVVVPRLGRV